MSPLSTFMTTWTTARRTFGDGVPADGVAVDGDLARSGKELVRSAAPRDEWSGSGSVAYGTANSAQIAQLTTFADIDRRFAAQIDRSAEVVGAGRRDLDALRRWMADVASTVPDHTAGQHLLWSIVGKGMGDLQQVVTRSAAEQTEIAGRIRALGDEYSLLGADGTGGVSPGEPESPAASADSGTDTARA